MFDEARTLSAALHVMSQHAGELRANLTDNADYRPQPCSEMPVDRHLFAGEYQFGFYCKYNFTGKYRKVSPLAMTVRWRAATRRSGAESNGHRAVRLLAAELDLRSVTVGTECPAFARQDNQGARLQGGIGDGGRIG